jgi:hypothetical protein
MTTSERELARRVTAIKEPPMPMPAIKRWMPVQRKRDPVELSEITVHDVDIIEVWRRGLVLRAAPFLGQATSTG